MLFATSTTATTTEYFLTTDFLQLWHFNLSAILWTGAVCIFLLTIILVVTIYE